MLPRPLKNSIPDYNSNLNLNLDKKVDLANTSDTNQNQLWLRYSDPLSSHLRQMRLTETV